MGNKRDMANENIKILIEELIDARIIALGSGNCPYYEGCHQKTPHDCGECKEKYFGKMRKHLLKEYVVK